MGHFAFHIRALKATAELPGNFLSPWTFLIAPEARGTVSGGGITVGPGGGGGRLLPKNSNTQHPTSALFSKLKV